MWISCTFVVMTCGMHVYKRVLWVKRKNYENKWVKPNLHYLLLPLFDVSQLIITLLLRYMSCLQHQLDPFSLVADELSLLANRLRAMVVAEVSDCTLLFVIFVSLEYHIPWLKLDVMWQVPKLASAAEYFFKMGVEGKRFRPTVRKFIIMSRSCFTIYKKILRCYWLVLHALWEILPLGWLS